MATYPPLPNIIRVRLTWTDGKGRFGSRFFLDSTTSPYAAADLNYLASQVSSLWGTNMAVRTVPPYALVQVDTQDMGLATGAVGQWTGSVVGTATAGNIASSNSMNIRPLIADHYRGGHPVLHHPPPGPTNLADSRTWLGTFVTGQTTAWTAFMNAIGAINHGTVVTPFQVVPRHWTPGGTTAQVEMALVTAWAAQSRVGTMRARLST